MAGVSRQAPGFRLGVGVLACTRTGLLADAGVLAACFGLGGHAAHGTRSTAPGPRHPARGTAVPVPPPRKFPPPKPTFE